MAKLGDLYFDVLLRDKTDAQIAAIKNKLNGKLKAELKVTVNKQDLGRQIQGALRGSNVRLNVRGVDTAADNMARVRQSIKGVNNELERSPGLLRDLKGMFLDAFSAVAARSFLDSLVRIGGQLENQKIALGAILQDVGKADVLFSRIKSLAIKSPFGIMDLNSYAKQLSAYSTPYNELYDTMKRLADISAGVGVDMGRIILAFGQIKAAKFLKGTELRQLTEANVPMVDKLAERFSILKGRIVSAGEVLDMISKKQVSFEDVKDVLWKLTDDGGMFHNMQEVMSESVASKFKNLGDAIDVMLGNMANNSNGLLKGIAEALTSLALNADKLSTALKWATGAYILFKAAQKGRIVFLGAEYAGAKKVLVSDHLAARSKAQLAATYRSVSGAEKRLIDTSSRHAMSLKSMTYDELRAAVASRTLTKELAMQLYARNALTKGQMTALVRLNLLTAREVASIHPIGRLAAAWVNLKTVLMSVFNWQTLAMAGVVGVVAAWQKATQKQEDMETRIRENAEHANEALQSIMQTYKELSKEEIAGMSEGALMTQIEQLKTKIQDNFKGYEEAFNEIFRSDESGKYVHNYYEQLTMLQGVMREVIATQKELSENASMMEFANDATDGWLDESMVENLRDASDAWMDYSKVLASSGKHYIVIKKRLDEVRKSHKDFDNEVVDAKAETNIRRQLELLERYAEAKGLFSELMYSATHDMYGNTTNYELNSWFDKYKDKSAAFSKEWQNASEDVKVFMEGVNTQLKAEFGKVDMSDAVQRDFLRNAFSKFLESDAFKDVSDEVKRRLTEEMEKQFHIKINPKIDINSNALAGWKADWARIMNMNELKASIKAAPDMASAIDAVQRMYKAAKDMSKELDGIVIKAGIKMDLKNLPELSTLVDGKGKVIGKGYEDSNGDVSMNGKRYRKVTDTVAAAWEQLRGLSEQMAQIENASKKFGFNLGSEKKKNAGGKGDKALEKWKSDMKLIRSAYEEFRRWAKEVGNDKALEKLRSNNVFGALFQNPKFNVMDIRSNVQNQIRILEGLVKRKPSEGRKNALTDAHKVLLGIDFDETKDAIDEVVRLQKSYLERVRKQWESYVKLREAGMRKDAAALFAFGDKGVPLVDRAVQGVADALRDKMKERGVDVTDIFALDEAAVTARLGGKDSELYKMFFEQWKSAKSDIEKDTLTIRLDEAKVIAKYASLGEKVRALTEKYLPLTGGSVAADGGIALGSTATEGQRAYWQEYREELSKLRSEALALLPVWDALFGDTTYKSYRALREAMRQAEEITKNATIYKDKNGKPTSFTSKYKDGNGNEQNVGGTYADFQRIKKAIEDLGKTAEERSPFKALGAAIKDIFNTKGKSAEEKSKDLRKLGKAAADSASQVAGMADGLSKMFDALGNKSMASAMQTVSDGMNTVSNIGKGFAEGGLWGGIAATAGETINWIGKLATAHDDALQDIIEASKQRVVVIERLYDRIEKAMSRFLGNGRDVLIPDVGKDKERLEELSKMSKKDPFTFKERSDDEKNLQKRIEAYKAGGAYGYQEQLLMEKRLELQKQLNAENDKKNGSQDTKNSLQKELDEINDQIRYFAEDLANTLYGIDLKGWAQQFGDALFEAWQKGESGAEAFDKTVGDIMGNVVKSMMTIGILEPMMSRLREKLFGKDGTGGWFGTDKKLDRGEVAEMAKELMGLKDNVGQFNDAMDAVEKELRKQGVSMQGGDSSGLQKGVQAVTEQTADLLASYINSMRADVSVNRQYLKQLVDDILPGYSVLAKAQLDYLSRIEANTSDNAYLAGEILDVLKRNENAGRGFKIA